MINIFDSSPGSSFFVSDKQEMSLKSMPVTYRSMVISSYHKEGIDKHEKEFQDLKFVVCFHGAFNKLTASHEI